MKKIPLPKFLTTSWGTATCIALAFVPSLVALVIFGAEARSLQDTKWDIQTLTKKVKRNAIQQTSTQKLLAKLENADPYYLEKSLEGSIFLKREMEQLEAAGNDKRLSFLKGEANRLSFAELGLQRLDRYQEVEARQKHPVELDGDDLKRLLGLIEGDNPSAPQLVIKQLEIIRKPTSSQSEVFLLNLELLKREKIK
jgi:hypothetical protein